MGSRHSGTPMNLLRRDRSNRERFDPFIDRYGRGLDSYFEDLPFDSRPRRVIDSQTVDMSRLDPHSSIERSIVNSRKVGKRPVVIEEFIYPTLGSKTMAQKVPLPFGRAMNKLIDQLGKAEEFYSSFQRDFDSNIGSIKKYATAEVLNELWILRVLGKKDPKVVEGDDAENDDSLRDSKELFADMRRDVARALETALDSTMKERSQLSHKKQARMESAKRLQRKIDTANEQILELLGLVMKGREYCTALLNELEFLMNLMESEKNKELYKSGDDGDEGSGLEDEGNVAEPRARGAWED